MADSAHRTAKICNPKGLHMRAVREVVQLMRQFEAKVAIHHDGQVADARSALELLSLLAGCHADVEITAEGADAEAAANATADLISCGFHELEDGETKPTA